MKLDNAQRGELRGRGPTIDVDRYFVEFVAYLRDERGIPLNSIGISPQKVHGWESKIAKDDKLTVRMGVIILLCDSLDLWPNREPRLPCITQRAGDAVWTYLRKRFGDWAFDAAPLLDSTEIERWRHATDEDIEGSKQDGAKPSEAGQEAPPFSGGQRQPQGSGAVDHRPRLRRVPNPYRGLMNALQAEESHLFFGRTLVIRELVESLQRKSLLAVMGPSGVW